MKVSTNTVGRTLYLYPIGELDHHGAKDAVNAIESKIDIELPQNCVLVMSGISFMDSSGIAVILKAKRRAEESGSTFSVRDIPPQPMKILRAAGIARLVNIK